MTDGLAKENDMTHLRTHSPIPREADVGLAETVLVDTVRTRPATTASPDTATHSVLSAQGLALDFRTVAERKALRYRADQAVGIGGF